MSTATILFLALLLDAALGEPRWLWSRLPHPAVLAGRLVDWLDQRLNAAENRKWRGVLAVVLMAIVALVMGGVLHAIPDCGLFEVIAVAILLAHKSLVQHVGAVADALRLSLGDARRMVARIVGRDTAAMDATAVSRAAIESGAENFSDGVIAPAFWYLIGGLPGLMLYKIVNTADSMIGHRTPRHEEFGWAAARLDDLMNWVPARLSAALIALVHLRSDLAPAILRDAPLHRSPNAGWPEAAMAGVLDASLSGPRAYEGKMRDYPLVYPEGRDALGADDIDASVAALWRAWAGLLAIVFLFALF